MAQSTKASGNPISTTAEESSIMLVEISTRENLWTIWLKALVSIDTLTDPSMLDIGTRTNSTDSAKRSGMTVASIRDSTRMHRKRAKESTAGQMATDLLESGATICSMVWGYSYGMMTGCSLETGKTI